MRKRIAPTAVLWLLIGAAYFLIPLDGKHAELIAGALVIVATVALVPLAVRQRFAEYR